MKKSIRLLSVLLVLFAGSLVTSCDVAKELAEELAAPENTWCEMYVEYGSEEKKANLVVDAIYVDEQYKGTGSAESTAARKKLSPEITLEPGITIVITVKSNSDNQLIDGLTDNTYIIKHFDKNTVVETDDDTEGNTGKIKLKGSKTNWNILYRAKADLRNEDNQISLPDAPDVLTYKAIDNGATSLNDPKNFSWSKLLKTYLLSTITDKLE